ncbi:MAG: polymerase sigma factor RpoD [Labilithrix sp.]|nr:polymerase sigma factor RpoD [Labilithrix sp.]
MVSFRETGRHGHVCRYSNVPSPVDTRLKNTLPNELDLAPDAGSLAASSHDPLELHFRSMTAFRLLTREDEHSLARQLEKADLSLTRALLAAPEGRAALRDVAAGLRDKEIRLEDVERNPGAGLEERIERAVAGAEATAAAKSSSRAHPKAYGLRLHPRIVRELIRDLEELEDRQPRNARLRRMLRDVDVARREGERVTTELVQSNLRIVVTFARRYRGMPLVDLIQEGNLGLLRAVDKFDHRRGLRFSTYAAWWIRHALGRALADQSKMIRLPVHLTGAVQRVRRAQERLQRETGRAATPEELATRTGLPIEQVRRALDVVAQPVSLDTPVSGGSDRDGADLGDFVVDQTAETADDLVAQSELRVETKALLSELPEREAEIIRLRFGLNGGVQKTLEEIGARLSLSRERARQLERDALKKLRVASEKRRLRVHLGR